MPLADPVCGFNKIRERAIILGQIEAFIALGSLAVYVFLILYQAVSTSCEELVGCVIDTVILVSIFIGSIFNFVLQVKLLHGLFELKKYVNRCSVWLGLRVITLPGMYVAMFYLCRGFGHPGVRAKVLIIILLIPIMIHIWAWYAVLECTHQFRVRRQNERPPAPLPEILNVEAPRSNLMNLEPKPPTTSSELDEIPSAGDNNNNIV